MATVNTVRILIIGLSLRILSGNYARVNTTNEKESHVSYSNHKLNKILFRMVLHTDEDLRQR